MPDSIAFLMPRHSRPLPIASQGYGASMPKNNSLRLIIRHEAREFAYLEKMLDSARRCGLVPHILLLGPFTTSERENLKLILHNFENGESISSWRLQYSDNDEALDAINHYAGECGTDDFLFFLSTKAEISGESIAGCAESLEQKRDIAGLCPIFLDSPGPKAKVLHMGTVADSQGFLHYLYEGIPRSHKLARKKRFFQQAHSAAALLRAADFMAAGGLNPGLGELAFFHLWNRLRGEDKRLFLTVPDMPAILHDKWDSWKNCGLWNSLLCRDKLPIKQPEPDYHLHIAQDGLEYGIGQWLCEGPLDMPAAIMEDGDQYFIWRHNPSPIALLKFLGSLDGGEAGLAIGLCREFPSSLPRQMAYYKNLVQRQLEFARKNGLEAMADKAEAWQKSQRIFHYRHLRPGMAAIARSGVYNWSLDRNPAVYEAWLELSTAAQFKMMEIGRDWPQIAIAMPVWNPEPRFLLAAIESVKAQSSPNWNLLMADDASTRPEIAEILRTSARDDPRIRVVFRTQNGHICQATNSAIELANAPWLTFLDQDDLLAKDAIALFAEKAAENPALRFMYSDEDHIDARACRRSPYFRNAGDHMFLTGHMLCYRLGDILKSGGMREGLEGSQDFDLRLRLTEKLEERQIAHIPHILYHWRIHEGSTSGSLGAKPYVLAATRKALEDAAKRGKAPGASYPGGINNFYHLLYEIPADFSASIILHGEEEKINPALMRLLLELADKMRLELLWQPLSEKSGTPSSSTIKKLPPARGGFWKAMRHAAGHAAHEALLFLHCGLEPLEGCRPEQLMWIAAREKIAAVGSMFWKNSLLYNGGLYPNISGMPFPLLKGTEKHIMPYYCWGQFTLPRKAIGFSWLCFASRREIVADMAGDFEPNTLSSARFALERQQKGERIIISPWGQWRLPPRFKELEPSKQEKNNFMKLWGEKVAKSPLRNPNLQAAPDYDWTLNLGMEF